LQLAHPTYGDLEGAPNATAQYMHLMYFVDKEFENVPSTCGGDTVKKPTFGLSTDECARACDASPHSCVGFSYFPGETSICFLISKFKSVTYYTGCGASSFVQHFKKNLRQGPPGGGPAKEEGAPAASPLPAECFAKLSKFEGTTLKPNPSGKCDMCLKSATKADRCF